jgi:hypothetical protein
MSHYPLWLKRTLSTGVRITHTYEDGIIVNGIAADTQTKDLRGRCVDALACYRAATGHEPAWLSIDSTEEHIDVR